MNIDIRRQQNDAEGLFYRKIVEQSPRDIDKGITQGIYIVTPDGRLLEFVLTQLTTPQKLIRMMKDSLRNYKRVRAAVIPEGNRFHQLNLNIEPPTGGIVVRVASRYPENAPHRLLKEIKWREKFGMVKDSVGLDVLWVRADENRALQRGQFPDSLMKRIVRYHLMDSVFSHDMKWKPEEILKLDTTFEGGKLKASIELSTANKVRRYSVELIGYVKYDGRRVTRFDLVSKGVLHTGKTHSLAAGRYPLEIAFTLATGDQVTDRIPPNFIRARHNSEYLR